MVDMNNIIIVGDLFPVKSNFNLFSERKVETLFGHKICQLFHEADYSICNLEGALTDGNEKCDKTGPVITAPISVVNAYSELGIKCCMLANNHVTDAGHQGVLNTMSALANAGIKHIGAGENKDNIPHYITIEVGGMSFVIYNVSETMYNKPTKTIAGAWLYDEYVVCRELKELRKSCDYMIVIYHGGVEKFRYPSPETRLRFHRMADCGADMVLSQHTHCIGSEENYKGSYLLYGQGDFLFNNFRPGLTDSGLIIELEVENGHVSVRKHKVRTVDFKVRFEEDQDMSDFEERSTMLLDDDYVYEQFKLFCNKELYSYLYAFKSPSPFRRIIRRISPSYFKKWLFTSSYKRRDLMFTLHTLRSEQNRETAIVGIQELLKHYS